MKKTINTPYGSNGLLIELEKYIDLNERAQVSIASRQSVEADSLSERAERIKEAKRIRGRLRAIISLLESEANGALSSLSDQRLSSLWTSAFPDSTLESMHVVLSSNEIGDFFEDVTFDCRSQYHSLLGKTLSGSEVLLNPGVPSHVPLDKTDDGSLEIKDEISKIGEEKIDTA